MITPKVLSGFKDRLPKDAIQKAQLLAKVSVVFQSFGFVPIETPHLEYAQTLLPDASSDIQKEIYRFKDHGDRDVALRFDLTVPLARFVSLHHQTLGMPFKRYAIGNVFRGERAQKGRYREFTQCDFDFIGSESLVCDAEIVQVIIASLKALDLEDFCISINHRKILNGICEYFGVSQVNEALRIVDKLEKIGLNGVGEELKKECDLDLNTIKELLEMVQTKQNDLSHAEFFEKIAYLKDYNENLKKGIQDLERLYQLLGDLQISQNLYKIDFSIARGLGYYTGIVYETTLNGMKSLGSVCSGGRYDHLTKNFSKENLQGVGASIGIDRLIVALSEMQLLDERSTQAKVLIACMHEEYFSYANRLAESLRQSGIFSEVYPEAQKIKKPFSYANHRGHEFVAVIGEEEFKSETLSLKNMHSGMQLNCLSFLKALEIIGENDEDL
ncbi:histidine--tRNA ligase [Helicobacter pylori]|uniref:histidine--tRNA ligase n=1 Tax=Helicobacter pylori TaxID=210 RepID=UPI0011283CCE|nr:histidine--tRNA ligase [Helicobacter pylori]TPH62033.1 histidine--tRNA ligase [Helicobacter pylori]